MKNSINIHHKYNCRNPGRTLFSGIKEKFVWQVFSTFSYRYCITCCKLTSKFVGRVKVSASLTTCHIWFALCSFCILHTWRVFFVFINCIWVSILPIRRISIKKKCLLQVFFILRKKQSHVTFLHVYHHTNMVLSTWAYLKYVKGKECYLFDKIINYFIK